MVQESAVTSAVWNAIATSTSLDNTAPHRSCTMIAWTWSGCYFTKKKTENQSTIDTMRNPSTTVAFVGCHKSYAPQEPSCTARLLLDFDIFFKYTCTYPRAVKFPRIFPRESRHVVAYRTEVLARRGFGVEAVDRPRSSSTHQSDTEDAVSIVVTTRKPLNSKTTFAPGGSEDDGADLVALQLRLPPKYHLDHRNDEG